jgi:uracil-DNA glycosylase family 4
MDVAARLAVRSQVKTCTRCELGGHNVPFRGPTPAKIAIVGEAPGKTEETAGRPFVGDAGKLLDRWLTKVGIDPESVFVCNTVSCRPAKPDGGNRVPSSDEVQACRENLLDQLRLANPEFLLVLGATALATWMPYTMGQMHGRWFMLPVGQTYAMATYHPAAVLTRWTPYGNFTGGPRHSFTLETSNDMAWFARSAVRGLTPTFGSLCFLCGKEAEGWIRGGLPVCSDEYKKMLDTLSSTL